MWLFNTTLDKQGWLFSNIWFCSCVVYCCNRQHCTELRRAEGNMCSQKYCLRLSLSEIGWNIRYKRHIFLYHSAIEICGFILHFYNINICKSLWKALQKHCLPLGHNTDILWSGDSCHCSGPEGWTWCWKGRPTDWRGWRGDAAGSAVETGSVCGALGRKTRKTVIVLLTVSKNIQVPKTLN